MTDKIGFIGCCSFKESATKNSQDQWLNSLALDRRDLRVLYHTREIVVAAYGVQNDTFSTYVDDDIFVIFFGEIYRENPKLTNRADKFRKEPLSSSFLLAQAYKLFGSSGVFELEGIFCSLIFDIKRQKILLFRDDSSFKFLYYHYDSKSSITFGTNLDLLMTSPHLEKRIAHQGLHEYLRAFMIYPPLTIYQDVFSVTPGYIVEFSDNTPKLFCPPKLDIVDSSDLTFEQCVNEFSRLMTESVKVRIDGGNDPAFFLSGGLDSSLLCCLGKSIAGSNINAFTIGFEDPKYDESNRAAELANYLKIRHHQLIFEQKDYMEHFHKVIQYSDQPFADPAGAATFYAFDLIKEYTHAIIDGTGGDSLIGTMPPRYKRVATQYVSLLPKSVRELSRRLLIYTKYFQNYEDLFDFEDPLDFLIMWKAWRISEIEKLCNEDVDLSQNILYQIYRSYGRSKHFEKYSAMYRYASDDRIHQAGRVFGVNVRFPFWDQKVQSFADGLRNEFRYREGEQKRIIGAALEKHVPKDILSIQKTGFVFPILEFMRQNNAELIHTYLNPKALKMHEMFDYKLVQSTVDRFLDGDNSMKFKVWGLVVFQAWYQHHF